MITSILVILNKVKNPCPICQPTPTPPKREIQTEILHFIQDDRPK